MIDSGHKRKRSEGKGGPLATGQAASSLSGEYTSIRVPIPPASAFNKDRPAGCLLQAQLRHFHHAESVRLPKEKRDGRSPEGIRSEAEAAAYIAKITKLLHPQRRKKPKPSASA